MAFKKGHKIRLGMKHTEETKSKIKEKRKNQIFSKETREKLREINLERRKNGWKPIPIVSEERKKQLSIQMSGKNNIFWKGGINKLTPKIRHSMQYKKWRKEVFERDKYICVVCGFNKGHILEADHIKSFSEIIKENNIKSFQSAIDCEELWNIDNGRTLCKPCHKKTHTYLLR